MIHGNYFRLIDKEWIDLAEKEAANSAELTNSLQLNPTSTDYFGQVITTSIESELKLISDDLDKRWKGAIFSLKPNNLDAARHICTCSREVILQMIDLKASDELVKTGYSHVQLTYRGEPTRSLKIEYLLTLKHREEMVDFTDSNIANVLTLIRDFNDGTHSSAGKYSYNQLLKLKTRVEDSIKYLYHVSYKQFSNSSL